MLDLKQLDWEMKRDTWLRGADTKSKIRDKMDARKKGGGKRPFNKGRRRQHTRHKGSKGKGKQKRKK